MELLGLSLVVALWLAAAFGAALHFRRLRARIVTRRALIRRRVNGVLQLGNEGRIRSEVIRLALKSAWTIAATTILLSSPRFDAQRIGLLTLAALTLLTLDLESWLDGRDQSAMITEGHLADTRGDAVISEFRDREAKGKP